MAPERDIYWTGTRLAKLAEQAVQDEDGRWYVKLDLDLRALKELRSDLTALAWEHHEYVPLMLAICELVTARERAERAEKQQLAEAGFDA